MRMTLEDHQSWRKSSYSGSSGTGDCVEVRWRKSSYSGTGASGSCVEVALGLARVGVRDSKNAGGAVLVFLPEAWRAFARSVS